ncbi:hypothetical protein A2634_02255 [Candidatus Amesbacteria bacterium RIFCSPHIGHO2_01_FULL_48_32]|uniref:Uncharacterized protein n=1 Tax=Candidatus Amesbacteria bacterium RIFCSPLOWO2_01_FULL_48_25 TaxID=1797259 RepID=A0A1F4ZDV8_9BACT|nr:MAG: hypothetical protein A2634_02255 [Candidatus Amesbacteria bacterium RIFCSPHIGHO2_01_FULL_48_32]OGD04408.1 MAG: hypothetical protein A2989_05260 [Candidatus Amesbacteria bacterium RIFCSPLOWO2_01_FULL_48_25]HJZ06248.1 hypothetical protein [Patescibacteria group bacterium]
MLRTTVSLPEPTLKQWRVEAFRRGMTLGEIILDKAGVGKLPRTSVEEEINADFARFDRIAKHAKKFDAVAAVREDRDRNDY